MRSVGSAAIGEAQQFVPGAVNMIAGERDSLVDETFPAEVKEAVAIFFRRCNRSLGHRERKPGITVGIDEQAAYDLERSASFGRRIKCDVEAPVEPATIVRSEARCVGKACV